MKLAVLQLSARLRTCSGRLRLGAWTHSSPYIAGLRMDQASKKAVEPAQKKHLEKKCVYLMVLL